MLWKKTKKQQRIKKEEEHIQQAGINTPTMTSVCYNWKNSLAYILMCSLFLEQASPLRSISQT